MNSMRNTLEEIADAERFDMEVYRLHLNAVEGCIHRIGILTREKIWIRLRIYF